MTVMIPAWVNGTLKPVDKLEAHRQGLKHLARWDGVTRKPTLQGPGNAVSAEAQSLLRYNTELAALDFETGIILELLNPCLIQTRQQSGPSMKRAPYPSG